MRSLKDLGVRSRLIAFQQESFYSTSANLRKNRISRHLPSPIYYAVYTQRTAAERINSQAKEFGIGRPKVRNQRSVERLNTLTSIIINVHALQKAKSINRGLLLR